ncbi:PLC-like phosphodiesterase [Pisolithus croceorrhizus]|nr:PLC-like phosphodiesterase [Pisolithus croceorrhizus]
MAARVLPECWGHRGASATFPENTLASFEAAIRDGAEGIESGLIRERKCLLTIKEPRQTGKPNLLPRILLGLWHPRFVAFAKARLPYCRRSHIGVSTALARKYFWNDVDVFSMAFASLASADGSKTAGKRIMVWTVNKPEHMMEAVRWGVDVVLTDVTQKWLELRGALQVDYDVMLSRYGRLFLWTTWQFYFPAMSSWEKITRIHLESVAGPFDHFVLPEPTTINSRIA